MGNRPWAVITGASSGLGVELARNLAGRKHNLVLTARGATAMEQLAAELRDRYDIQVHVEPLDLGTAGSAAILCKRLETLGVQPDILVNNAAFGMTGPFLEQDDDRLREMLQLDMVTPTELTLLLGRGMATRGNGRILFVGSLAAFQPTPSMAAYGAAKAYILSFAEALHVELAPQVSVSVVSPGLMDTGFNAASGFETPEALRRTILSPATVASIGLDALFEGRSSVVAGRLNKLMALSSRLFSRHFAAQSSYRLGHAGKQRVHG